MGATLDRPRSIAWDKSVVLVIDDGSDDQTAAVVQSRADENVLLLWRQLPAARQGKGAALNAAVRHLVGTWSLPVLAGLLRRFMAHVQ